MNNRLMSALAASALMLGGCTIGPDYVKPSITVPESFGHSEPAASARVDSEWWKRFDDPRLNSSIDEALRANHDLQSARFTVESMLGQFDQAKSYLYPQINANGSYTRKGVDNAASGGYTLHEGITSTYAASLALTSYEIDLFGKVRRANEAARAMLLSSEYAKETLRLSIAANVAASYMKLASLQEQIVLAQTNVETSREIMELTELKYRHGVIAETAYLQSQSEYENARATLSQLQASKISEEANFNLLLGRNPSRVSTTSLEAISVPEVPEALPSEILTSRPDIAAAEQNLIAANAQIGIARAQYFPSIKLTGMMGIQSLELNDFLSNPAKIWEIAPSLSVPLFSAGRIAGEIKTAEADQNKTLAQYQKTIVSAFNDTDNALGQAQKAKEQMAYQSKRSAMIEKAYEQARLQYRVGSIAYNDMLIVQQQWLQAKQNYLISRQNGLTAAVNLYKALGGGWKDESASIIPDLPPAGR